MEFIGKLHPLLLHLPIGVLIYTAMHWLYARVVLPADRQPDFTFALGLGSLSAIFSAISGWMLAREGGYDLELLDWHKYLGIATAVMSLGLLWAYRRIQSSNVFGAILFAFMGLLTATGHYGGSLTHGVDFLSASAKTTPVQIDDINEAHVFSTLVMPIIEKKCVSCHNPQKSKGDLLLHNLEGWLAGGDNGEVVKAGFSLESSLINRIFLPKEDEKHMPPDGKLQLTNDERVFLKWWVDSMATYDHVVKELGQTKEVAAYLGQLEAESRIDVDRPSLVELQELLHFGIVAELQAKDKPWVDVSLSNPSTFDPQDLSELTPIAEAIRSIDLSNAKLGAADLEFISALTHVEQIVLSNCSVGSNLTAPLKELETLRILNLYGTSVDRSIFEDLLELPALEKVFVWNTNVEKVDIENVLTLNPSFEIDFGVDFDQFGTAQLVSPIIAADQDLFEDSLLVRLETKAQRATIKYALNSLDSFVSYTEPFYIYSTKEVRAKLIMNGWEDSEIVAKTFAKSRYKIHDIAASVKANKQYPADGLTTVIDLSKGSSTFGDGKWLGYFGDNVTYTIDLGSAQEVSGVTVGTLSDFRSYIHAPKSIKVEASIDGKAYSNFAELSGFPTPVLAEASVHNHYLTGAPVVAQYIKIAVENQKVNPDSHPAPGATCWLFIDEVLVD